MGKLKIENNAFTDVFSTAKKPVKNKKELNYQEQNLHLNPTEKFFSKTNEPLTVAVKISHTMKMQLGDILRKHEQATGKFVALNQYINNILMEHLKDLQKSL